MSSALTKRTKNHRIGLKFSNEDDFGNFCQTLTELGVPFGYGGFEMIVVTQAHLDTLPDTAQSLYAQLLKENRVKVLDPPSIGIKKLPSLTRDEALGLLDEIAE